MVLAKVNETLQVTCKNPKQYLAQMLIWIFIYTLSHVQSFHQAWITFEMHFEISIAGFSD